MPASVLIPDLVSEPIEYPSFSNPVARLHSVTKRYGANTALDNFSFEIHPGEIVSREDLLEKVWGYDVFPSTRTVDNFILRLRKRFERDPANPKHFLTVWGVGYRFMVEGEP